MVALAAAFGYGVALGLADTRLDGGTLLDRVDRVCGVSGGSFLATQLALDHDPPALADFRQKILLKDIEGELLKAATRKTFRLMRRDFSRTDVAAAWWDENLGATPLDQLPEQPELWIQATDLKTGRPLVMRPEPLRAVGLDPGGITLGSALAASSAFPGAFPPLVLEQPQTIASDVTQSWQLADGGIVDNLGLEALFQADVPAGSRAVVVLVVNGRRPRVEPKQSNLSHGRALAMLLPIQQRRLDELLLLRTRERLRSLELQATVAGKTLQTRLVVIDLDQSPQRQKLRTIRTRLALDQDDVNVLIAEGRKLLNSRAAELLALWKEEPC